MEGELIGWVQEARTAASALIVNAAFSVALMFPLKHGGIALATSIASAVGHGLHGLDDLLRGHERELLEIGRVGHRHVLAGGG